MEFSLKDNVIFYSFDNENALKEMIIKFIRESKLDKVLYKGNPTNINYKLLKKILPLDQIKHSQSKNSINNFVEIKEKGIREVYTDFLEKIDTNYCIIYKI